MEIFEDLGCGSCIFVSLTYAVAVVSNQQLTFGDFVVEIGRDVRSLTFVSQALRRLW